jgi:hypothetical protein
VVHAPEEFGPKDASGVGVLKPISRKETTFTPLLLVGIISSVFVVLISAVALRQLDRIPTWILGVGAFVLAPPVVWSGYGFLRDDELEPHRGLSLAVRVLICSIVYAALWAAYVWVPSLAFSLNSLELFHLLLIVPPLVLVGGLAAFASLDLDFGTGVLHYGFYLLVTVVLCLIMDVDLLGTSPTEEVEIEADQVARAVVTEASDGEVHCFPEICQRFAIRRSTSGS